MKFHFWQFLNFSLVEELVFGHFWNCKKWNLVKHFFRECGFMRFFCLDFFKFSGQLCSRRRVVCVILESGMKKRAWKTGLLNEMMLITLVLTDLNLSSIWSNVPPTYSELEKKCLLSILKNYYYAHCALWFIMGDGGTRLGKDAHWVILPFA